MSGNNQTYISRTSGLKAKDYIGYAMVDTQSQPYSGHWPTTKKQFDLALLLKEELQQIGATKVYLDQEACVVYGRIPANIPADSYEAVGFIAHMDTAPDASGTDVKPWVLENYDGKDSMRIYVEASGSNDFKALQQQIAAAVKSRIGFTPIVYVVELGFLPRSEKKSKRVIDERFN